MILFEFCQWIRAGYKFKTPGFEKEEFELSSNEIRRQGQDKTETVETFFSDTFIEREPRSIDYARPVERITPLVGTVEGSVLVNERLRTGKPYATIEMPADDFFSLPGRTLWENVDRGSIY